MFGNKGFGWKLGSALMLIAGLGILSAVRGSSINPALWRCLAEPARWEGTTIWVSQALVVASDPRGFEIEVKGARARVVPAARVSPGEAIELVGTFRARGPEILVRELRSVDRQSRSRLLSEVVSITVLGLIVLNFLRHFSFRPEMVQAQGTAPARPARPPRPERG